MTSDLDNSAGREVRRRRSRPEGESDLFEARSVNTIFSVLAHPHRRCALNCLREQGTMTLSHLADEVAARAFEQSIDGIAEQVRERVFLSLYHSHVPCLAEADLVEYNRANESVALGEAAEQAMPFLSLANNGGRETSLRLEG